MRSLITRLHRTRRDQTRPGKTLMRERDRREDEGSSEGVNARIQKAGERGAS